MRSKDKRTQTLIFCLSFGLVLVLSYIFIGRPISNYSKNLRKELASQSQKIKEFEDLIRAYPNPEKEIEKIKKKLEELKERTGGFEQIPRIIQHLARKSNELNISVISIKPVENIRRSSESLIEGVGKVYIEMAMLAPYQVIGDYLKVLPELPITLTVEELSISKRSEDSPVSPGVPLKGNELLVTLLLSAYVVPEI